ncbi:hypothetical protein V6Z11_D13G076800 [Gossypium hirsutum]
MEEIVEMKQHSLVEENQKTLEVLKDMEQSLQDQLQAKKSVSNMQKVYWKQKVKNKSGYKDPAVLASETPYFQKVGRSNRHSSHTIQFISVVFETLNSDYITCIGSCAISVNVWLI